MNKRDEQSIARSRQRFERRIESLFHNAMNLAEEVGQVRQRYDKGLTTEYYAIEDLAGVIATRHDALLGGLGTLALIAGSIHTTELEALRQELEDARLEQLATDAARDA